MGGCVSSHAASVRSASLPSSAVQSPNPQSPDVLCHGLQTRTTSESQSDSSSCPQTADGNGLLTGNKRSSLSTDMEQLQAVYEQQHDSLCPLPPHHSLTAVPATFCQRQLHAASLAVDAADEFNSRSASPDELDRPYLPPPPPAPIAVYRLRDDDDDEDDDSEGDEADEDGKLDELELISEEQVFAAARDSFDDDQSISTAPIGTRRISLLASAPPGASISSSLSSLDSPHSMERRLTVTVSVGSFHVLLVDEDEQHAQLIARWLRKKQFVVTVCADGEEAVSLMQEIYEVSRARHSFMASSHTFSHHSQQLLDPSDERLSVSSSAADSATQLHDIDLIICDACMNGTDGQPFLDYCKQSPAFAHVPIVLMSVDVESAAVNRSINRGAYDHWAKPLARPLLQNTVRVIREGKKEERKASLLREWGDRYKQTMLEERKAAIGQGHQPHTLSATPLTSLRSAMLLTPLAPSSRVLPPLNGAMGGWSAAASYGQLMAHEGRTFAVVLSTSDDEQHNEQDRLREWLGELHVEHSVVGSVAAVSQRVERMVRSRDRLAPTKKRGKSWQTNSFQSPMPVARIQEEKEAEQTSTDSSGDSTARRRDEANREKVKGIIGLMRQHSRSQTSGGLAEQFMDRDVDLLIVDLDELDDSGLTECYQLLEKATDKAVSIIGRQSKASCIPHQCAQSSLQLLGLPLCAVCSVLLSHVRLVVHLRFAVPRRHRRRTAKAGAKRGCYTSTHNQSIPPPTLVPASPSYGSPYH